MGLEVPEPNKYKVLIDLHNHHHSSDTSVRSIYYGEELTELLKGFFSAGIHPWYLPESGSYDEAERWLESMISNPSCVAVGEAGVDKAVQVSMESQISFFQKQILLSELYQKPLVIHCVKAHSETAQLKERFKPTQAWVIHGFDKNEKVAEMLLNKGFYLSFGFGIFKNEKIQKALIDTPLNRLFLETDAVNDLPISSVYEKAAALKSISLSELETAVANNFLKVRGL